jgi:hypothetical protein
VRIGTTPLALDLPPGEGSIELRLSKQGFVSEALRMPADRDAQAQVVLQPRAAAPSKATRASSAKRLRAASIANATKVKRAPKGAAN